MVVVSLLNNEKPMKCKKVFDSKYIENKNLI